MKSLPKRKLLRPIYYLVLFLAVLPALVYFFSQNPNKVRASTSAYLNGSATVVGTTETNIGSLVTTLPTGDNLIIASVTFSNTNATITSIAAAGLSLKKGATVLASNEYQIRLGGGSVGSGTIYPQATEVLLFKDVGAAANPTYDVTATAAAGALITSQTKIIVISGAANSSFQDGASVAIGTTATTILSHTATGVPAGAGNIIIAAVQTNNTGATTSPAIAAGALTLQQGATVLQSNVFSTGLTRVARPKDSAGYLMIYKDTVSEAANPVYTINATENLAGVNGEAKIMVISGLTSDFVDGTNTALGTTETTLATLNTTLAAGENVVLSAFQIDNAAGATAPTIAAGNERLYGAGAIQAQNANLYSSGTSTNTEDREFYSVEIWREASAAANAVYSARDFANITGVNGAARILAIHLVPATNPTFTQGNYRFSSNADSVTPGAALAANNTAVTLGSVGAAFRLRQIVGVATANLGLSGQAFKLQFAVQSGTCDTGFVGETYADVTTTSAIAYKDNPTPIDGANIAASAANDPTSAALAPETYEELNNFTNSQTVINTAQDGMWDLSLVDNAAPANITYCLRVVKSDGTVLDTYSQIPQVTTSTSPTKDVIFQPGINIQGGTTVNQ